MPPNSRIPSEISEYHLLLKHVFELSKTPDLNFQQRIQALEALWQAFQWFLEPFALQSGIDLLELWPDLQLALYNYAELLYPQQSHLPSQQHPANATKSDLPAPESWQKWLKPKVPASLSICMIVKNEVHCLAQALDSAQDLATEIIIIDTGSNDDTQTLAKSYDKVRLFEMPWPEDFAKARNFSLAQAHGDWILILDADEVLLPTSAQYIQQLTVYKPLGWHSFAVKIHHHLEKNSFESWAPRLFCNHRDLNFTGAIHELPCKRSWPYYLQTLYLPIIFEHSGSLPLIYQQQKKPQRAQQLAHIIQSGKYSPFIAYQYAYLLIHQIDIQSDPKLAERLLLEALTETQKYQDRIVPQPEHLLAPLEAVVLLLAELYVGQTRYEEACRLYQEFSLTIFTRPFIALAAMSQTHQNQLKIASITWMRCFDPNLVDIKYKDRIQIIALEALLDLALRQEQAKQAIWVLRRLRFDFPDGCIQDRKYDFQTLENRLCDLLQIEAGSWLHYLDQNIKNAILTQDFEQIAWSAMAYLCESWDQTVLCDAIKALHHLQAPNLVLALAQWGKDLYPEQVMFQMFVGTLNAQPLEPYQSQLPGGTYWLKLCTRPKEKPIISLCMIVKNAAHTVLKALKSVEDLVDHYIIADTGSEDSSWELLQSWAENHTSDIFKLDWPENFAQARNTVIARAQGDWILVLDADEYLLEESVTYLKKVLAYAPNNYQLFALHCSHIMSVLSHTSQDYLLRIFARHPLIRYWGALHEIPGHLQDAEFLPVNSLPKAKVEHIGFNQTEYQRHQKSQRTHLLPQSLKISEYLNPHFAYHYAYNLVNYQEPSDLNKALSLLQEAIRETIKYPLQPPLPGWFPAPLYKAQLLLMRILSHQEKDSLILESYPQWAQQIQDPEYHYWFALAALRQQKYPLAYEGFKSCLGSTQPAQMYAGFGTWKALLGMTHLALQTHNWSLGLSALQCLLNYPEVIDAQSLLAKWSEKMLKLESETNSKNEFGFKT